MQGMSGTDPEVISLIMSSGIFWRMENFPLIAFIKKLPLEPVSGSEWTGSFSLPGWISPFVHMTPSWAGFRTDAHTSVSESDTPSDPQAFHENLPLTARTCHVQQSQDQKSEEPGESNIYRPTSRTSLAPSAA